MNSESLLHENPQAGDGGAVHPPDDAVAAFHQRLPGHRPTPMAELESVAANLGLDRVYVKVESNRFDLPSFKLLGPSWAIYRALVERTGIDTRGWNSLEDLAGLLAAHGPLTLAAATGAATMGALLSLVQAGNRGDIGLDEQAVVLLVLTEGATDPVNYERTVGRAPYSS